MTLQAYLSQRNPKKLWIFTVEVKEEDCLSKFRGPKIWWKGVKRETYFCTIKDIVAVYRIIDNQLWTTDEDGNPKKPSVFYFKEDEK